MWPPPARPSQHAQPPPGATDSTQYPTQLQPPPSLWRSHEAAAAAAAARLPAARSSHAAAAATAAASKQFDEQVAPSSRLLGANAQQAPASFSNVSKRPPVSLAAMLLGRGGTNSHGPDSHRSRSSVTYTSSSTASAASSEHAMAELPTFMAAAASAHSSSWRHSPLSKSSSAQPHAPITAATVADVTDDENMSDGGDSAAAVANDDDSGTPAPVPLPTFMPAPALRRPQPAATQTASLLQPQPKTFLTPRRPPSASRPPPPSLPPPRPRQNPRPPSRRLPSPVPQLAPSRHGPDTAAQPVRPKTPTASVSARAQIALPPVSAAPTRVLPPPPPPANPVVELDKQLARLSRLSIRAAENHHVELQAYKQSREADRRIVDIELVEAKDALDAHQLSWDVLIDKRTWSLADNQLAQHLQRLRDLGDFSRRRGAPSMATTLLTIQVPPMRRNLCITLASMARTKTILLVEEMEESRATSNDAQTLHGLLNSASGVSMEQVSLKLKRLETEEKGLTASLVTLTNRLQAEVVPQLRPLNASLIEQRTQRAVQLVCATEMRAESEALELREKVLQLEGTLAATKIALQHRPEEASMPALESMAHREPAHSLPGVAMPPPPVSSSAVAAPQLSAAPSHKRRRSSAASCSGESGYSSGGTSSGGEEDNDADEATPSESQPQFLGDAASAQKHKKRKKKHHKDKDGSRKKNKKRRETPSAAFDDDIIVKQEPVHPVDATLAMTTSTRLAQVVSAPAPPHQADEGDYVSDDEATAELRAALAGSKVVAAPQQPPPRAAKKARTASGKKGTSKKKKKV